MASGSGEAQPEAKGLLSPHSAWHAVDAQLLCSSRVPDIQPCLRSVPDLCFHPALHHKIAFYRKKRRNRGCVCSGECLEAFRGSQVAGLTFTPVQEAAPEPGCSHYPWLCPSVISRLHLATPGVPSSITDHCLVPPPPSPTTSCQTGLLVNKPVCSYPENYLIPAPFIPNTIHPSTACSTGLVRKMGMGEGGK